MRYLLLLLLAGCAPIQEPSNLTVIIYQEPQGVEVQPPVKVAVKEPAPQVAVSGCSRFILPDLMPLPPLPVINEAMVDDHDRVEGMLIDHIGVIRSQNLDLKKRLIQSYRVHERTCSPK